MMSDKSWASTQHENDGLTKYGGRDLMGYGEQSRPPKWKHRAKVALNFVINYEEGAEKCVLHGDRESEHLLSDSIGAQPREGERNLTIESMYEYGSRAGFWRLHRMFTKKKVPCTVFACGMALERNPQVCLTLKEEINKTKEEGAWEVASHGYRWIDYQHVDEETEMKHIERTIEIHERLLGKKPVGLYQGKPSINSRRLAKEFKFMYDSDDYSDDLPYWNLDFGEPHLVIPYTLTENDMRFVSPSNFQTGAEFCKYLKDTLRFLVEEGRAGHAKMMTVGLHCRLMRPGRAAGISDFIDYAKTWGKDVWICTREDIANHWFDEHYPIGRGSHIGNLSRTSSFDSADLTVQTGGLTLEEDGETQESEDVI